LVFGQRAVLIDHQARHEPRNVQYFATTLGDAAYQRANKRITAANAA
jgi:hypothetical protein